eukprot:TRINITY_DN484_c0_g1_i4.p1 TRINITY_DN484_c0_g1~~TRINITY_DN484_c0_g1_i4.p1  ORF type:complete len:782 (-),score=394.06 TRINITY_DN484_c0_g1_i4:289-2634(-)
MSNNSENAGDLNQRGESGSNNRERRNNNEDSRGGSRYVPPSLRSRGGSDRDSYRGSDRGGASDRGGDRREERGDRREERDSNRGGDRDHQSNYPSRGGDRREERGGDRREERGGASDQGGERREEREVDREERGGDRRGSSRDNYPSRGEDRREERSEEPRRESNRGGERDYPSRDDRRDYPPREDRGGYERGGYFDRDRGGSDRGYAPRSSGNSFYDKGGRDSYSRRDDYPRREDRGPRDFPRRDDRGGERGWGSSSSGGGGGKWGGPSSRGDARFDREEENPFEEDPGHEDPHAVVGEVEKIEFERYDDIPVETSGTNCPPNIETWEEIKLHPTVENNIRLAKFTKPTPIQKYSLPIVLENRDLMGCAQTGSGKTAAFLLPVIEKLLNEPPQSSIGMVGSRKKIFPSALVLAPTRELACQIYDGSRKFCYKTGLKTTVVYGGTPIINQLRELERGCDILIATPGRLVDIIDRAKVSLSSIRFLTLDEADRMLDMGFEPQIRRIVEEEDMPRTGDRQTLMFSATFPKEIQRLAASFLNDYIFLAVGRVGSTTDLVTQKFLRAEEHDKNGMLLDLLASVKGLTLIFVETKRKADQLEDFLQREGFPATSIHGDRDQADRAAALRTFSNGQTPYLVATSVAARGLHIENVAHVINYDMPTDANEYVHRIGRTGRAGKPGQSTAFISEDNMGVVPKLLELLQDSGQEIPPWLGSMKSFRGYGSNHHGGGNRRGGPKFGGKDFRSERGGRDDRSGGRNDSWGGNSGFGGNGFYSGGSSGGSNWF